MNLVSNLLKGAVAAAALAAFAAPAAAATPGMMDKGQGKNATCFFSRDWQGWRSPSDNVIYIRVGVRDIYRIDLSAGSSRLKWPDSHLINEVRGSSSICSALDLDLKVSDSGGFPTPLIAKSLTRLTPEQVAAIPKKDLP